MNHSLLLILACLVGVLWSSPGVCVDGTVHSFEVVSTRRIGRKGRNVIAHDEKIDQDDEDYAVDKGEEQKETIAQVSVSVSVDKHTCICPVQYVNV